MSLQDRISRGGLVLAAGLAGALAAGLALAVTTVPSPAQDHAGNPLDVDEAWIVEDLEAGYALAKETGKPLLVAFR